MGINILIQQLSESFKRLSLSCLLCVATLVLCALIESSRFAYSHEDRAPFSGACFPNISLSISSAVFGPSCSQSTKQVMIVVHSTTHMVSVFIVTTLIDWPTDI